MRALLRRWSPNGSIVPTTSVICSLWERDSRNGTDSSAAAAAIFRASSNVRSDLFIDPVMHSSGKIPKSAPCACALRAHSATRVKFADGSPMTLCIAIDATRIVSFSMLCPHECVVRYGLTNSATALPSNTQPSGVKWTPSGVR